MCTWTDKEPKLEVAKKDIVVFKSVYIDRRSYFFGLIKRLRYIGEIKHFKYKPNKVYKTTLDPFTLHITRVFWISGRGFYSYSSKRFGNVKCIIPKGSHYYKCRDRKIPSQIIYHSDKIKILSQI